MHSSAACVLWTKSHCKQVVLDLRACTQYVLSLLARSVVFTIAEIVYVLALQGSRDTCSDKFSSDQKERKVDRCM